MNLWLRLIWHALAVRRRPPMRMDEIGRLRLRVMPGDLDVLGHVNNGVYLSMLDLGRAELLARTGAWSRLKAEGMYPVVSSQTISYRKSLAPWQRFVIETRLAGCDDRSVFIEHRFTVDGEIYARAIVRGRFLRRSGGTVSMPQLFAVLGLDEMSPPEPWIARWAADVALPSTRAEAPSVW